MNLYPLDPPDVYRFHQICLGKNGYFLDPFCWAIEIRNSTVFRQKKRFVQSLRKAHPFLNSENVGGIFLIKRQNCETIKRKKDLLVNKNRALHIEDIPKITRGFGLEFHSWNQSNFSDRNSVFVACQKEAVLLHIFQLEIWSSLKIIHFQNFTAGSLLNDFRDCSILLLDGKAESNWCKIPNWCFVGRRTDLNLHIYPSKFHLISQSQSPLGMKKVVLLCIPLRQHDIDRQNRTNSYLNTVSLYGGLFVLFWPSFASDIVDLNSDFLLWWLCF